MTDKTNYTRKNSSTYCPRCGRKTPHKDYRDDKKNPCPATPIPEPRYQ